MYEINEAKRFLYEDYMCTLMQHNFTDQCTFYSNTMKGVRSSFNYPNIFLCEL